MWTNSPSKYLGSTISPIWGQKPLIGSLWNFVWVRPPRRSHPRKVGWRTVKPFLRGGVEFQVFPFTCVVILTTRSAECHNRGAVRSSFDMHAGRRLRRSSVHYWWCFAMVYLLIAYSWHLIFDFYQVYVATSQSEQPGYGLFQCHFFILREFKDNRHTSEAGKTIWC